MDQDARRCLRKISLILATIVFMTLPVAAPLPWQCDRIKSEALAHSVLLVGDGRAQPSAPPVNLPSVLNRARIYTRRCRRTALYHPAE